MTRRSIIGLALLVLAGACGSGDEVPSTIDEAGDGSITITVAPTSTSAEATVTTAADATTTGPESTTTAPSSTLPPTTMGDDTTGGLPDFAVDAVLQIAAEGLGVAADDVGIVSVEEMTWSDAAMGCPEPDTAYAQVVTTGFAVVLEGGGATIELHVADDGSAIVTC